MRHPVNPFTGRGIIIGEGKPENQNHAAIFAMGEALQTIDMNQDNTLSEALKVCNVLKVQPCRVCPVWRAAPCCACRATRMLATPSPHARRTRTNCARRSWTCTAARSRPSCWPA